MNIFQNQATKKYFCGYEPPKYIANFRALLMNFKWRFECYRTSSVINYFVSLFYIVNSVEYIIETLCYF